MGFRFRRTIRIAPGIHLNISKSGLSTSIGGKGAMINIGEKGTRGTVGLPGSGISYSEKIGGTGKRSNALWIAIIVIAVAAWFFLH